MSDPFNEVTRISDSKRSNRDVYDDEHEGSIGSDAQAITYTLEPHGKRAPLVKLSAEQFNLLVGNANPVLVTPSSNAKPDDKLQSAAMTRFVSVCTEKSTGSGVWIGPNRFATIAHVIMDAMQMSSVMVNLAKYRIAAMFSSNRSLNIKDSSYIIDVVRDYGNTISGSKKGKRERDSVPNLIVPPDIDTFAVPSSEIALSSPLINGLFANLFVCGPDGVLPLENVEVVGPMMVFTCPKAKPGYSGSPIFGVRDGKLCLLAALSCQLHDNRIGAVCFARDNG